eukprot:Lithocolla_globosa_v1_NODE_2392_length_2024_cov_169.287963.p2 type:complete len:161 gc:universal NODE_2392_length_2024_cov_169.287963:549-67(-)
MKWVVMGVSGSGKSVMGKKLAKELQVPFFDADDFHPKENKEKMLRGFPLTDKDREGWLESLAQLLHSEKTCVLACSALKEVYRNKLSVDQYVGFIYLKGSQDLIQQRLSQRKDHFFNPALLESQFQTLEEPVNAVVVDIALPLNKVVSSALTQIKNKSVL